MAESAGYPNVVAGRAAGTNVPTDILMDPVSFALYTGVWVWNSSSLVWEKMTQPKTSDTANLYVWSGAAWVEMEQPKTTDNAEIYGYNGTNFQHIKIDQSTRSIQTVSYPHHEAHAGKLYHAYRGDTLATNDTIMIAVTTPAGAEEQHVFWQVYSSGEITFDILESVTSYTGGTAFTPKNHNHRSANTSNCTVKVGSNGVLSDGIAPTGGTEWDKWSFGSGSRQGGTAQHDEEHILDAEKINIYRITAVGNNIVCDLHISWYEHTPQAA